MNLTLVEKAREIALYFHAHQINKHDGEPYILHVHRVAASVAHDPLLGPVHEATAWLHDIVEDTELDLASLVYNLLGYEKVNVITQAVKAITKIKGESNEDYYLRVKENPIAAAVKLHDIYDNFGRVHLIKDSKTVARLSQKYSLGIDILKRAK